MDKYIVPYLYNETLLSNTKGKLLIYTTCSISKILCWAREVKQSVFYRFHLYNSMTARTNLEWQKADLSLLSSGCWGGRWTEKEWQQRELLGRQNCSLSWCQCYCFHRCIHLSKLTYLLKWLHFAVRKFTSIKLIKYFFKNMWGRERE